MYKKFPVVALPLLAALAGCDQGPSGPQDTGTFSVLLTDAPGDFEKAVVTVDKVYLQTDDAADPESGRVYLMETPVTVNLLDLRNEALNLVKDEVVPGGRYAQLRLVISGGYLEVEQADGTTKIFASSPDYQGLPAGAVVDGSLQMPSYAQSGLKINLPGGSVEVDGDQKILLLDFNVAESFGQQAGQSGMWVMTPVIRASDLQLTGGVEYSLSLAEGGTLPSVGGKAITLADFHTTLDKNGDVLKESFVDQDGTFKVNYYFLEPGTSYPVAFVEPDGINVTLDSAFPSEVSVTSGSTSRQAFTITGSVLE